VLDVPEGVDAEGQVKIKSEVKNKKEGPEGGNRVKAGTLRPKDEDMSQLLQGKKREKKYCEKRGQSRRPPLQRWEGEQETKRKRRRGENEDAERARCHEQRRTKSARWRWAPKTDFPVKVEKRSNEERGKRE